MDKDIAKKFVENTGFICTKCGMVVVDGYKHDNEEDLCDNCRIANIGARLVEKEHSIEMLNQHLTDKAIEIERLGEELKELKEYHDKYPYSYSEEYMLNNKELKQQLAKKDKEIESYLKVIANDKQFFMRYSKGCEELQERQKQMHNQDKIELLEKVRNSMISTIELAESSVQTKDQVHIIIDTLISEIKGE